MTPAVRPMHVEEHDAIAVRERLAIDPDQRPPHAGERADLPCAACEGEAPVQLSFHECPSRVHHNVSGRTGRAIRARVHERRRVSTITPSPIKPIVSTAALDALDVRVGTIAEVADIPGPRMLAALIVDFGDHGRRILAGLKQARPAHSAIAGRQALFVVNLEPKKMTVPNGTRAG